MKKHNYLLLSCLFSSLLFFTTISSYGQSLVILPEQTISQNTVGDNFSLKSNSPFIGIQSNRYNGTSVSKTAVLNGDYLLRLSGGGNYNSIYESIDRASIFFRATQHWSDTTNGTKISFLTTHNFTVKGAINTAERMVIDHNGNVGIGNSAPTARLQVHSNLESPNNIYLQSEGQPTVIKASSGTADAWFNTFYSSGVDQTSSVNWNNSASGISALQLSGAGDAIIGRDAAINRNAIIHGYTGMGGYSAPKIKMKKLTLTTSAASAGEVGIAHGLTQAKILSVSVLVNGAAGNDIVPNTTFYTGYEYTFYISSTSIVIHNSAGNHSSIANRPARILITYEE